MKGSLDGPSKIGVREGLADEKVLYNLAHELAYAYLHFDKGNTIADPRHEEYEEQADRTAHLLVAYIKWQRCSERNRTKMAVHTF